MDVRAEVEREIFTRRRRPAVSDVNSSGQIGEALSHRLAVPGRG